ncbi:MAG: DUF488 family protein [Candidatus Eisenbacteria bacterium]|nr:DUF488 family protein [Candidatus Eisenbacteria bacterium]
MGIQLKRIYEAPSPDDGIRILVDRLWPRGLSKADAKLDDWLRSAAPSNELRKWFHADRSQWGEFRRRYLSELKVHSEDLRQLSELSKRKRITLLYSSKDEERNNAVVLREYLLKLGAS